MPDEIVEPPVEPEIPDTEPPVILPPVEYPIGYEPDPAEESIPQDTTDPTEEEANPEDIPQLPIPPVDDGKIDAEGSVWRLHFLPGQTPTEDYMLNLTSSVKATMVVAPGENLSRITPQ